MIENLRNGLVLHDFIKVAGGAERVVLTLADRLSADLIVGFESQGVRGKLGFVDGVVPMSLAENSQYNIKNYLTLIKNFKYSNFESGIRPWIFYSGNFAPLAAQNLCSYKHMLYCNNLPRFIYDRKKQYDEEYQGWKTMLFRVFSAYMKYEYERSFRLMDVIFANSANVQHKIKKYMGCDSIVVYPPCEIANYWNGQGDYYVSTARLEKYKRVDTIIKAFMEMPKKRLIVLSGGREEMALRNLANGATNITFTGWVDQKKMNRVLGKAIASIYVPEDEDFGMSPVESMASGKPVIGVSEGGLNETILDGATGMLIDEGLTTDKLIETVESMSKIVALSMKDSCILRAGSFSREKFIENISKFIYSN